MGIISIFFLFVVLIVLELVYFKVAAHFNIIDHPNERSSHTLVTLRGGGIIFPISSIIYLFSSHYNYISLISGIVIVGVISFLDDIFTISNRIRLFFHLIAVAIMLYPMGIWSLNIAILIIIFIVIIGVINAYNFMDGINGITGLYSLITILTLLFLNTKVNFIDSAFLMTIAASLLVFLFFNFRKRAKCFAGDVGSVSIAFIIVFCLISFFIVTNYYIIILLLAVYGVDSVVTIVLRLSRGENIFTPHRSHVYQILSNERGFSHLAVASIYGVVQLMINGVVIYVILHKPQPTIISTLFVIILTLLLIIYFVLKRRFRLTA